MNSHLTEPDFERVSVWVNGGRLASLETTPIQGRPIVLVPGLAMSARYLRPLAAALADHFSISIVELPGSGESDSPTGALTMRQHADVLAEWLRTRRFDSLHLVGHSMGCQVAAHVAALCRARVETLTLIGPTTDTTARSRFRLLLRLLRDFTREPLAIHGIAAIDLLRTGIATTWRTSGFMLCDDLRLQLRRVEAPTLLLRGRYDSIAPAAWLANAVARLRIGRARTLPHGSHCVHFSHPRLTAEAIRAWIAAAELPRPDAVLQATTR